MRADTRNLSLELERAPEDWSVRIRLIEAAAREGNLKEAKYLVRTSPGNDPLPAELQSKIHALLLKAAENDEFSHLPKADL